jgi:uncharacterized membrane protein
MANGFTVVCCIALFSLVLAVYYYPLLPSAVAIHWNLWGNADGFSDKEFGVFFLPVLLAVLSSLFFMLPFLLRQKMSWAYEGFMVVFSMFVLYMYSLILSWNALPLHLNLLQMFAPGFAIIFWFTGFMIERVDRNILIGIRTPWTLASDKVWKSTHALGGAMFKFCAISALLGVAFPQYAFVFVLAPVLLSALALTLYSYFEYRKTRRPARGK